MFTLSVVDLRFKPRSGQTKDSQIVINATSPKSMQH